MRPPGSRARPSIPRAASCGRERHKRSPCVTITPLMKLPKKISRLFREPPRTLFDDLEDVTAEAPVKGPLFSNPVFYALLAVFGTSLMLTADWIGLLLLNSEGVFGRIGTPDVLLQATLLLYLRREHLLCRHLLPLLSPRFTLRAHRDIWMKKASGVRRQASGWSVCLTCVRPRTVLLKPETCSPTAS